MEYQRRLRDLREDHDKTQQEIADVLGTSQTMYARYEHRLSAGPQQRSHEKRRAAVNRGNAGKYDTMGMAVPRTAMPISCDY